MNEAKLQEQKNKLVKNKYMEESDHLLDYAQGNTWKRLLGPWGRWRPGWIYFTEKKIICFWGFAGSLVIPYDTVSELGTCSQMFLPFGITITHTDKDGKVVKDKISVQKRNERLKLISEKSGVAVSG